MMNGKWQMFSGAGRIGSVMGGDFELPRMA